MTNLKAKKNHSPSLNQKNHSADGYKQTKLGRIPVEWESRNFEDVVEIDSETLGTNVAPDYTFKYVSLSDVDKGTINPILPQYSYKDSPSRARRIIKKGDILLSTVRPNLQAFAILKHDTSDHIASTGFADRKSVV